MSSQLELTLPFDAFVRSVGVNCRAPWTFLVGAGASISSDMPSAQMCIWEWKRRIFLTNNPGLEDQFVQLSLQSVRQRIQSWLNAQGRFPQEGDPREYSFYIQACFPILEDRRAYFQEKVRNACPHIGYKMLCHLALQNLVRSVWSTNFDGLAARAAGQFSLTPIEVGIDSQQRLLRPAQQGEFRCISLHGDYRYDELKNTPEEVQSLESLICQSLIKEVQETSLIISGYSGRDQSIMNALSQAYAKPGTGMLFWCGIEREDPPQHIAALIRRAREHGREAYYVSTNGFDDLMIRLALHCLEGKRREAAKRCVDDHEANDLLRCEPFHLPRLKGSGLIKSNAFKIQHSENVLQFDLKVWPIKHVWASLRETTGERQLVVVPFRGRILAIGTINDIQDAFSNNIKDKIELTKITEKDLRYEDSAVFSLIRQVLVRSLAKSARLETDGKKLLWHPEANSHDCSENARYSVHEAAEIFLRKISGVLHLVLKPSLKIFDQAGNMPSFEISNAIKIRRLGYQHNNKFNQAIERWREILFPDKNQVEFEFPFGSGSVFKFLIHTLPNFAEITFPSIGRTQRQRLPQKIQRLVRHRGIQLPEPPLLFFDNSITAKDIHPIRGLISNRPYDYPLTSSGLSSTLRLGVICPEASEKQLYSYLQSIHYPHSPHTGDRDYLIDYPGFQEAYGLQLILPEPGSNGWINCPEPVAEESFTGSLEAGRLIERSIQALQASFVPNLILIFIPDHWRRFRGYRKKSESFDLHNSVKASCVQRGIATQFLEENTLNNNNKCRVWWWLSLAMYVKSMRTPWLLENLDDRAAFVGLGFSVDTNARRGDHIVIGSSHIYSGRGEGLQYRLSKIENSLVRRGNPFLSRDDARQIGESIRQLFF